jgi:hypothetical protein
VPPIGTSASTASLHGIFTDLDGCAWLSSVENYRL